MTNYTRTADIENARVSLGFGTDGFLRDRGWKSTSTTPGCYVLWTREWKGVTIMVSRDMAFSMERNYFEPLECVCSEEDGPPNPGCRLHHDEG